MKKILAITLSLLTFLSSVSFIVFANAKNGGEPYLVDDAFTAFENSIANDKQKGTSGSLSDTNWYMVYGTKDTTLTKSFGSTVDAYMSSLYTDGPWIKKTPNTSHYGYTPQWYYEVTSYEAGDFSPLKGACNGISSSSQQYVNRVGDKGILFTASDGATFIGFGYDAPMDGTVTLSDPQNGFIESVWEIGTIPRTGSLDSGSKSASFAIYKNGTMIWPENGTAHSLIASNTGVHFPKIEDISVKEGDKIVFLFKKISGAVSFALNPCVTYTDVSDDNKPITGKAHNAYEEIKAATEKDLISGVVQSIYDDSHWIFETGTYIDRGYSPVNIEKVERFFTYGFDTWTPTTFDTSPMGYKFRYTSNFAAYNATDNKVKPKMSGTIPEKGVMVSAAETGYVALTYTASESGTAVLHDPQKGYISAIQSVGGKTTYTLDTASKKLKIAIYVNRQKVWPVDSDYYTFTVSEHAVKFPTIRDITVRSGDKVRIVFKQEIPSGTLSMFSVAMNPQISFTSGDVPDIETDKAPVEDDKIINMINATSTSNAAETFKAAIDADVSSGKINYLSAESPWSIQQSTAGYASGWSELSANVVKRFFIKNLGVSGWPSITGDDFPYGYQYHMYHDWAVYNTADKTQAKITGRGMLPTKGMLGYFFETGKYIALSYKADKSGTVRLYDPEGADITAVSRIGTSSANSLDTTQKKLHLAIYKNDKKLWPKDSDYFEFNSSEGSVPFPDIQGIQVNSGDVIRIIFNNASINGSSKMLSNMLFALNPSVDFIAYSKNVHDAGNDVDTAIKTDIENGTDGYAGNTQISNLYSEYPWRVEIKTDDVWDIITPIKAGTLEVEGATSQNNLQSALLYNKVALGAYNSSHSVQCVENAADSGIIMSFDGLEKPVSLTYSVTDEKYIRLRDIANGYITAVTSIDGIDITGCDYNSAGITVSVYKNDEKLWPEENTIFNGAVSFPDISVATEELDKIRIVFSAANPEKVDKLMIAMNPYVTGYAIAVTKVVTSEIGSLETNNAFDQISASLNADIKSGSIKNIKKLDWKIESSKDFGKSESPVWTTDKLGYEDKKLGIPMTYIQKFTVYNSASAPTENWPMAYAYGYNKFLAPFDQSNQLKAFNVSRLPKTGVVLTTMSRNVWHSLTFVADKDGEVHIYDPANGFITAIDSIDSVALRSCDYDANFSKNVEIAIYKNNEKLWPYDSDSFVMQSRGANEEKSVYFPDLVGVEVRKGDAIRIVIHSVGDSDTIPAVIAMNPQIDYTALDYVIRDRVFAESLPTDEPIINEPQIDINIEENVNDDVDIDDTNVDEDDDTEETTVRRKKKVIRVVTNNNNMMYVIIFASVGAALLIAAVILLIIVIKRKKRKIGGE